MNCNSQNLFQLGQFYGRNRAGQHFQSSAVERGADRHDDRNDRPTLA